MGSVDADQVCCAASLALGPMRRYGIDDKELVQSSHWRRQYRNSALACRITSATPCMASVAMIAATIVSGHPEPVPKTPSAASKTARLPNTSLRVQIHAERILEIGRASCREGVEREGVLGRRSG